MIDTVALREKVLDLAIRGKLVPQDPNDEPASVLLERIRAQKQQMVKDGKLKVKDIKDDSIIFVGEDNLHYEKFADGTEECIEDEIPFDIPDSWVWVRLGALAQYKKGPFGSSITKSMFVPDSPSAIKVYEQKNAINKDASLGNYFISEEKYESLKGFEIFPNDIIVSCAGTIGETYVMPKNMRKGIINQALMKITLHDLRILDFYLIYFDCQLKTAAREQGHGVALKNIPPFDVLKKYLVPIPPIQEQTRIVDTVNDLLGTVSSIDTFKDELFDSITSVKSKILDLAIRGKLVPQNPDDEPASVLLERIRAEKEELIKQGKIKRDKKESVIFKGEDNSYYLIQNGKSSPVDETIVFDLPELWEWTTIPTIANVELGKTLDRAKNTGTLYPYLRSVNIQWGDIDLSDLNEMRFEDDELEKYSVIKNDLLICEGGDVGRCCVWDIDETFLYQNALHRARFHANITPKFYQYVLMSYESKGILKRISNGVTIKHLTGTTLSFMPVPIPPVAEQLRIIAAIESLFAQLDTIAESLN